MLSVDTNVVTRAVGGQRDLHLDVAVFEIEAGDTMLLCSDGLYRELDADVLAEQLSVDVSEAVTNLMARCLAGNAKDNVSLVVARAS